jgi:hypothetical protein
MVTIEADAVVTSDGKMTLPAPANVTVGTHRVRLIVLEDEPSGLQAGTSESNDPKPKHYFLGRPVFDEEDLRGMASDLPSEDEWAREQGVS